jgi:hypothetical protein
MESHNAGTGSAMSLRRLGSDLERGAVTTSESASLAPDSDSGASSGDIPAGEETEKEDIFFQVIDVATDGQAADIRGSCYSSWKLDAFYPTIPAQENDTIRVFLDGRGAVFDPNFEPYSTGRVIDQKESLERNICLGFGVSRRFTKDSYPSPCPLYPSSAFTLPEKHRLLSSPWALWGKTPTFRRYGQKCFALHDRYDCGPRNRHDAYTAGEVNEEAVFVLTHVVCDDNGLLNGNKTCFTIANAHC